MLVRYLSEADNIRGDTQAASVASVAVAVASVAVLQEFVAAELDDRHYRVAEGELAD